MQPKEPEGTLMEESNVSINGDATISKKAVSSKVGSRKKHGKNSPGSDVGGSKVDSAEDQNPGSDLAAEKARQKAVQQELKKKKMGR
jgi:hypothetical protein